MALPLCVVLAGVLRLLLAIIRTARTQTPIWKTSSLAVLSRGGAAVKALSDAWTLSALETAAKDSNVTLFPDVQHGKMSRY